MSATLRLDNFATINVKEYGVLSADALAQGTAQTLTLDSTDGMNANDFLMLGLRGTEQCEIVMIQSITNATQLVVQWVRFPHQANEPAITLVGNKLKVYRALNVTGVAPDVSTYSPLPTLTSVKPDTASTVFTDNTGGEAYWYRYTFYNSVTFLETPIENSEAVRGGASGRYASVDSIRRRAGFENNQNIQDGTLSGYRQTAESVINAALQGIYTLPFSPVPDLVRSMTVDLAAGYALNEEYGAFSGGFHAGAKELIEGVLGNGKDIPGLLNQLKGRTLTLPSATSPIANDSGGVMSSFSDDSAPEPYFTRDMIF